MKNKTAEERFFECEGSCGRIMENDFSNRIGDQLVCDDCAENDRY